MKLNKAIITGPTGAVGISLIQELIENGYEVTAVCRPNSKRLGALPKNKNLKVIKK